MTEQHHPLCNEGVQAGDQTVPCNCPDGWPKVDPLHQHAEALAEELGPAGVIQDFLPRGGSNVRAVRIILAAFQRVQADTREEDIKAIQDYRVSLGLTIQKSQDVTTSVAIGGVIGMLMARKDRP